MYESYKQIIGRKLFLIFIFVRKFKTFMDLSSIRASSNMSIIVVCFEYFVDMGSLG